MSLAAWVERNGVARVTCVPRVLCCSVGGARPATNRASRAVGAAATEYAVA